jgi:hypothetical protein
VFGEKHKTHGQMINNPNDQVESGSNDGSNSMTSRWQKNNVAIDTEYPTYATLTVDRP